MASEVHPEVVIDAASPRSAPDVAAAARSERTMLLVCLSAAAGVIHGKAMIDHAPHYWLFGVFFGVLTYAQVLWAVFVYRRPDDRRWLMPAAIGSLVVAAIWLVSRTVGLPIGPWAGDAEPLAITDITATLVELLLAGLIFAILWPEGRAARSLRWLNGSNCVRVGSMLVALSLLAVLLGNQSHAGT